MKNLRSLEERQTAMRERMRFARSMGLTKKPKRGPGRPRVEAPLVPLDIAERSRQRFFAYGLYVRGFSAAKIAYQCETIFRRKVTVTMIENWIAAGFPLA